jgi:hypothetical protein
MRAWSGFERRLLCRSWLNEAHDSNDVCLSACEKFQMTDAYLLCGCSISLAAPKILSFRLDKVVVVEVTSWRKRPFLFSEYI